MRIAYLIHGCAAAAVLAWPVAAQEWKPAKNVDIVVSAAAGGSSDRSARVVQKLLQANPAFAKMIQGEDWKQDLEKNAWAEDYMSSADTRRHLDQEHALMTRMLGDLGVIPAR